MSFQTVALRSAKQVEFFTRRNAPTILTSVGVAGFVATTAFTIRATAKAIDAMPELKKRVQVAKDKAVAEEMEAKPASQELARAYLLNGVELAKIYAPTLSLGSASILCVMAGHGMMLRRQAQLAAVYAALDTSFKAYRRRVAQQIGEDEEVKLFRRPNMRALDQTEGDEDGPKEYSEIFEMGDVLPSPYARFFDETSKNWVKTAEFNMMFLRAQEQFMNDRLQVYGFVFLNEVYEALGLERSQAGQIVGWKKNGTGDGFISFGLADIFDENSRAFVNGLENVVLLDFNVDGVIRI